MESPAWYLGTPPDETSFTGLSIIRIDKYGYQGDSTCNINIEFRTATTKAGLISESYQVYNDIDFNSLGWVQVKVDNIDGTSCCDVIIEDLTIEFGEWFDLFRLSVNNFDDNVNVYFKFNTGTLQIVEIITVGTSSRNVRFIYEGQSTVLEPNDSHDVSSDNMYFVQVGKFSLPTLVLEGEYSITFI